MGVRFRVRLWLGLALVGVRNGSSLGLESLEVRFRVRVVLRLV